MNSNPMNRYKMATVRIAILCTSQSTSGSMRYWQKLTLSGTCLPVAFSNMPLAPSVIFSFMARDFSGSILPGCACSVSCTWEGGGIVAAVDVIIPKPGRLTLAELLLAEVKSWCTPSSVYFAKFGVSLSWRSPLSR
jgi:hypothetical protein